MWLAGYTREEIVLKVGHIIAGIRMKVSRLGLPRRKVKRSKIKLEPIEMIPTKGIVKCHNCLMDIVLSKKGLDKDYRGGKVGREVIFWHMPGRCPGDSNAHFILLEKTFTPSRSGSRAKSI